MVLMALAGGLIKKGASPPTSNGVNNRREQQENEMVCFGFFFLSRTYLGVLPAWERVTVIIP